ncbi:cytochrome P450 [Gordonia crocea]|uniref:Cytochrome P450 n=1 Tax=Gordonia crocea TaxID=589162 RepID=A0A7I9UW13_9ACTN|nr:cytochrome P450 [Gordonia crocea]GED97132.1 cytochrome P450 [Gordonia crocea]
MTRTMTAPPTLAVPHWHLAPPGARSGIGEAADDGPAAPVALVSGRRLRPLGAYSDSLRFVTHQGDTLFAAAARSAGTPGGDALHFDLAGGPGPAVVLFDPAHIKTLMTADESVAPSATHQSPLAPIVGRQSVLTSIGERHKQQRALLLPRFHGRSVANYQAGIERATEDGLAAWPVGKPVALADIAQRITLDVIMSAVFGLPHPDEASDAERRMRKEILRLLRLSTTPVATLSQVVNMRYEDPVGLLKLILSRVDRTIYRVLSERRAQGEAGLRDDILSLLLSARDTEGNPLSDTEIRDELMTLVLAGHETTANTVAWTFERLTRHPGVYRTARRAAANDDEAYLEALLNESMRVRPVVPIVARELLAPFDFSGSTVGPDVIALVSILLLHHRDDLYPDPFAFAPERFLGVRVNPYELMPFGGGIRRCLGAPLAMAELRTVVGTILRRVELRTHESPAEKPRHRNVTMIPGRGGVVIADSIT